MCQFRRKNGEVFVNTSYVAIASFLAATSTTAYAQEAPAPAETTDTAQSGERQITDIVVTAEKRARGESIQRVPIAITAVNAEVMERAQLTSITDVGRLAPSVTLNDSGSSPGFANFFIRGIGVQGSIRTIDPAVSLIVDGMVHEFQLGNTLDTFDIQSVEVLRGPQGILFGRNATGGAVVFTTRRPTDTLEGAIQVRAGSAERLDVSARISGPIIGNTLLGKIAVIHRHSDGLYSDKNRGTFVPAPYNPSGTDTSSTGDQVGEDTWIVHPTLTINATPDLSITLLGEYVHSKTGAGVARQLVPVPNLATYFGYTPDLGRTNFNHDQEGKALSRTLRGIAEVTYKTGAGVFTSISGYRKVKYDYQFDTDGTPFTLLQFPKGSFDRSSQVSEEFRFASDFSDVVSFVAGGYYSKLKMHGTEVRIQSPFFGGGLANAPLRYIRGTYDQDSETIAGFYNVDVRPIPEVRLSHGGRFTKDSKQIDVVPLQVCGANFVNCPNTPFHGKKSWNNYSPRFAAEFQATPKLLLYSSYTFGYRSGNYNQRPPIAEPTTPAEPELCARWRPA
jgi:iron complex outermembrane receptor protein